MSAVVFHLYRLVLVPLAWVLFQIGGIFGDEKWRRLREAKNARRFLCKRDEETIRAGRPFWIHAASGEIEYARPVLRELKRRFPDVPIVVTYGSPSAVRILEKLEEVDAWGPVPWEFASSVREFMKRFTPRALLIARTDMWPVLIETAHRSGLPSLLFAATFASDSSRLRGPTRLLTARALGRVQSVHVVSADDHERLRGLTDADKVTITGDTRFDQVLHRLAHPTPLPALPVPAAGLVLVAGSTWPEDERELLPAITAHPEWKLLLAPHEVGENRLKDLERKLHALGLESQRFSTGGEWTKRVLVLDRVGILAELYAWADLAFVGGSFRRQVHSVMEPLAAGRRVLVGPYHLNNREALMFQSEEIGGRPAVLVVRDSNDVRAALSDPLLREGADGIREQVRIRQGATRQVVEWCADHGGGC